jgi:hypothetical protein
MGGPLRRTGTGAKGVIYPRSILPLLAYGDDSFERQRDAAVGGDRVKHRECRATRQRVVDDGDDGVRVAGCEGEGGWSGIEVDVCGVMEG